LTKAQREKAERLMLKHLIDTRPKYKEIMDALIDNPDKELKDVIQPVIEEELKKARMIGMEIGWQSAMIQAHEKIKDIRDVEEVKACLRNEAESIRERMGLKPVFDNNGNLIVEEDEKENQNKD
jgi:hypothetical protein